MSNNNIFSTKTKLSANRKNNAGGDACDFDPRHCLAQVAATNTFNGTFYATAEQNFNLAKEAALRLKNDPEFIAKVAIYSRDKSYMKDMPCFLTVLLSDISKPLFRKVFRRVVDNGKMLRNVIQMARSGVVTGKKINVSAGSWRHAIQEWFNTQSSLSIFKSSIGNNPTMHDILRMSHPRPNSIEKQSLFAYLSGKEFDLEKLPDQVKKLQDFKSGKTKNIPDVDFRFLDSLNLGQKEWEAIAAQSPWQMTRMNLSTFARHGVFNNEDVVRIVANKLKDEQLIKKSRVFPYQLFAAWRQIENQNIPQMIKSALESAMEIAIGNVPEILGKGLVCIDCSGSMGSPITGFGRRRGSSSVSCSDVAGLMASAVYRKNKSVEIWTFSDNANMVELNSKDNVLKNTQKLNLAGGGTNISAPMHRFNADHKNADWILYVSDYESWIDSPSAVYGYNSTGLSYEWDIFKKRNNHAKLICCDLTPRDNSQICTRKDVLQVGGFSDQVFDVIASFVSQSKSEDYWVEEINKTSLE
jgi:60 kDa SS-A/Ro ribonucleoprotein